MNQLKRVLQIEKVCKKIRKEVNKADPNGWITPTSENIQIVLKHKEDVPFDLLDEMLLKTSNQKYNNYKRAARKNDWTSEEISILNNATTYQEAADKTGRTLTACKQKCKNLGIIKNRSNIWTQEELKLLSSKLTNQEIAIRTGRTKQAIWRKRRFNNVDQQDKKKRLHQGYRG